MDNMVLEADRGIAGTGIGEAEPQIPVVILTPENHRTDLVWYEE